MRNGSCPEPCQTKLARVHQVVNTGMSDPDLYITDSCQPVLWNCTARTTLIDPCSCYQYYECRGHGNGVVARTCPSGTAYDHQTKTCPNKVSVVPTQCRPSVPWDRCGLNEVEKEVLIQRCENKSLAITTTTQNPVTISGDKELNGNEAGFVIGAVFGALFLIVVILIVIAVILRRYRKRNKGKLTTKRSVQNPEYNFQPEPNLEEAEETYHVIDDNMNDPTYSSDSGNTKPPSLPKRGQDLDLNGGSTKITGVFPQMSLHNSDTLTTQNDSNRPNVQNGTITIYDNGSDSLHSTGSQGQQQDSNYIAIFPQDNAVKNTREKHSAFNNLFIISSGEST
uniref:receptor protein-tyrosine kinase n=1 Tax=Crassostrea virginica TaxID=6565 RepID=A0A8B8BHD1_CRAVI|nr:uncharacterized protein LOC111110524 isoform X2 [Crassostrea virginica]